MGGEGRYFWGETRSVMLNLWLWEEVLSLCATGPPVGTIRSELEGGREKHEGEWTGKVEIRKRKKFLAVNEACMALFRPTPGFKMRTFVSSGFSTSGDLNFCVPSPRPQYSTAGQTSGFFFGE